MNKKKENYMNNITITGNVTKDLELKTLQGDNHVVNFTVATDRRFKEKGEKITDFFNIVLWGRTAELAAQYLQKGSKCLIQGEMQLRKYTDKEGNQKISPEIKGEVIEFLGGNQGQKQENFAPKVTIEEVDLADDSDDQIPF